MLLFQEVLRLTLLYHAQALHVNCSLLKRPIPMSVRQPARLGNIFNAPAGSAVALHISAAELA
jgi:hypothetical protein